MQEYQVRQLSIRQLHDRLDQKLFAVPHLQREFVWNGRKAAALLDSIHRGMPVGMLLVWKTEPKNRNLLRNSLHILPPYNPKNREIWFLIDGQQRLSVIHQAKKGEVKTNSSGTEVDFGRLCLSLRYSTRHQDAQVCEYRKADERNYIAVGDVLDSNWRRKLGHLTGSKLARVQAFRGRLLGYKVPVVFISGSDLDEIRELFVRINSLGTAVGSADRVFARASRMDLRQLARDARAHLPALFQQVQYETLLQAFAFLGDEKTVDVGERSYNAEVRRWERQIAKDPRARKRLTELWSRLQVAFGKAIGLLATQCAVLGPAFLPSDNMLATLSVFFYLHRGQPNATQLREIKKWFWATGVGQRYSGRGYRENIQRDVAFFRRLARGKARFQLFERYDATELKRTDYARRSSLGAAFSCLLARQKPRYLQTGHEVPLAQYASRANRQDRHHIFPRALMQRHEIGAKQCNSLCNICFVVAEENQGIGSKRPALYLAHSRQKRFFNRSATSHLIPARDDSGLWDRNVPKGFSRFCEQRQFLIARAFEREAGMRLFRRLGSDK